ASGSALQGDEGAIAYDRAALQQAESGAGLGASRDQWRRTTAQAVGGLTHRLGATTGATFITPRTARAGEKVTMAASGLTPGDRFCLTGPGVEGERSLVVASDGELRAQVTLPRATQRAAYTVVGRDGSASAAV